MTVKEELHALVERLPDQDAGDVLEYLRARVEHTSDMAPTQAFVSESQRALEEAARPGEARIPHDAVRAWLKSWGTAEEDAAAETLRTVEEQAHRESRGTSA